MQDAYQWAAAAVEQVAHGRALLPVADVFPSILPLEYQTVRNKISNGSFPLPVLKLGSKNFIRTYDLVNFLAGGNFRAEVQNKEKKAGAVKGGKPGRPPRDGRGAA